MGLVGEVIDELPGANKVTTPGKFGKGATPLKKEQTTKKKAISVQKKVVGSTGSSASPMLVSRLKTPSAKKLEQTPSQQNTNSSKAKGESP